MSLSIRKIDGRIQSSTILGKWRGGAPCKHSVHAPCTIGAYYASSAQNSIDSKSSLHSEQTAGQYVNGWVGLNLIHHRHNHFAWRILYPICHRTLLQKPFHTRGTWDQLINGEITERNFLMGDTRCDWFPYRLWCCVTAV
jgi:hypothetical protein